MQRLMYAAMDIETIPCQTIPEECRPRFDEASVKLGNLKDRFKVEERIQEERARFEETVDKQMSTDPDLCQVCCFVGYVPGREFKTAFAAQGETDLKLLYAAWDWIRMVHLEQVPLVTFNGTSFDLAVLIRRAMIEDLTVSPAMIENLLRRYDNRHHYDLMQLLAMRNLFSGKPDFHGLDYYLRRFGLGGKFSGWTGAMVYPAWKEGRYEEIVEYCKDDVMKTARLFERVAPWLVSPRLDAKENPETPEGKEPSDGKTSSGKTAGSAGTAGNDHPGGNGDGGQGRSGPSGSSFGARRLHRPRGHQPRYLGDSANQDRAAHQQGRNSGEAPRKLNRRRI